jgi:hypothetical protein
MRRGVFEEYQADDGRRIYRLRWVEEVKLSQEEIARSNFIRYLISQGKLSESCEQALC